MLFQVLFSDVAIWTNPLKWWIFPCVEEIENHLAAQTSNCLQTPQRFDTLNFCLSRACAMLLSELVSVIHFKDNGVLGVIYALLLFFPTKSARKGRTKSIDLSKHKAFIVMRCFETMQGCLRHLSYQFSTNHSVPLIYLVTTPMQCSNGADARWASLVDSITYKVTRNKENIWARHF